MPDFLVYSQSNRERNTRVDGVSLDFAQKLRDDLSDDPSFPNDPVLVRVDKVHDKPWYRKLFGG